jgi:D-sedoheptulose 7-phosphate isomerase
VVETHIREAVDFIGDYLAETVEVLSAFARDQTASDTMIEMADRTVAAIRSGGKLLIAGNGGRAADAQHIAGEFISRLMYDRAPLPAIALTVDTSSITATANDYGYEYIFERQVLGLGRPGDVLLGSSTSGRSRNVLLALEAAKRAGLVTLGFCGAEPGPMGELCAVVLRAPSNDTPVRRQSGAFACGCRSIAGSSMAFRASVHSNVTYCPV